MRVRDWTGRRFAEHFRRMLFALDRLYQNVENPTGAHGQSEASLEVREDVRRLMLRAITDVEVEISPSWEEIARDTAGGTDEIIRRLKAITERHQPGYGELWIQNLYQIVANAVQAGQGILNDDLAFREGVARAELGFWEYALDILKMPERTFAAVLRRGGEIVASVAEESARAAGRITGGATEGLLSALFESPITLGLVILAAWYYLKGNK